MRSVVKTTIGSFAALALVGTLGGATGAEAEDLELPVLLRGQVPNGAQIQVSLKPKGKVLHRAQVGDVVEPLPLDSVSVNGSWFEVRARPSGIPSRYIDADGIVNVHVMGLGADGEVWSENIPAKAGTLDGNPVWVDSLTHDVRDVPASRVVQGSGVSVGSLTYLGTSTSSQSRTTSTAQASCSDRVTERFRANALTAASYPAGDRSWFAVRSSNGGRYGVAEKQPGQPVKKTGTMHASGGWHWTSVRRKATRAYRVEVAYVETEHRYRDINGNCQYYFTWEPTVETGGAGPKKVSRPQNWREACVNVGAGRWARVKSDGSPYSLSWGVGTAGVVGVNLSVTKQYSKRGHKVVYKVRGHKRMCGKGGKWPAVAPDVLERRR